MALAFSDPKKLRELDRPSQSEQYSDEPPQSEGFADWEWTPSGV